MKILIKFRNIAFVIVASICALPLEGKVAIKAEDEVTTAFSIDNQVISLKKCLKALKELNPGLEIKREITQLASEDEFTLEELHAICNAIVKKVSEVDAVHGTPPFEELKTFLSSTVKELKDYKVSGIGFANHGEWAFLYGPQNFNTQLQFKNQKSQELFSKGFNLDYASIGIQARLAYRFDMIFVVGADLNRFNTRTAIDLGRGFTISSGYLAALGITAIGLSNQPGFLVILHVGLGLVNPLDIAMVTKGGKLTPLAAAQ
jgi:hypothetical protein